MNRVSKRILSLVMVCIMFFTMAVSASAATVSQVKYSTTEKGGNKATVFYVNAKNKQTTKIKYSCTTGHFIDAMGSTGTNVHEFKGYFEVKIWGRNSSSGNWNYISKTNMKNVSSATISMKGYTQYKVQVYAWKTSTIGAYIGVKNAHNFNSSWAGWCTYAGRGLPTCTFKAGSNVKSLTQ